MSTRMKQDLPPREAAFCAYVVAGQSQSDAYRHAYPHKQGLRSKTINELASRLMAKPRVQARLNATLAKIERRAKVKREDVEDKLWALANFDPRKMFDSHGNPKEITDLDDNEAMAVEAFDFTEEYEGKGESRMAVGVTKRFKLMKRLDAIQLFCRLRGFISNDMKATLTGADGEAVKSLTVSFVEPPKAIEVNAKPEPQGTHV